MADLEYLSLNNFQRFFYRMKKGFKKFGLGFLRFFKGIPHAFVNFFKKLGKALYSPIEYFKYGDWKTRISFLIFGFGNLANKQIFRGILFLLYEIFFIFYMIAFGGQYVGKLNTLGTLNPQDVMDEYGVPRGAYDNSFRILLYGILSIVFIIVTIILWYINIKQAYENHKMRQINQKLTTGIEDLRQIGNKYYHRTLLGFPMLAMVIFTVVPLIFMICIAFTNYDALHYPPANLFGWVGFENFGELVNATGASGGDTIRFASTFRKVLGWTFIWAIFATFSNFIIGIILALVINKKGIKLKKVWRTILVVTIAVPQFISLLLMSKMLRSSADMQGIYNTLLGYVGIKPIQFLTDGTVAKITVLVVNLWIGVPYTVLSTSGILMNIPEDLYEAARIDGANPYAMFMKITMPYILFVMGPNLITTFIGNINNFNVIYLLTNGGGPFPTGAESMAPGAGETSLLITWLYKLTVSENKYGIASAIGIIVFIICALLSLIIYSRSSSFKNEEDFQ